MNAAKASFLAAGFLLVARLATDAPIVAAAVTAALPPDEIRAQVESVLVQRHLSTPPEWWLALGPQAPETLIQMYGETRQKIRRLRLLEALALYKDQSAATEFLKGEARRTHENAVRQVILESLGRNQAASTVELQKEFLAHEDAQTRLAAAQALQTAELGGSDEARRALDGFRATEKAGWILDRLAESRSSAASPRTASAPLIAPPPPGLPVAPQSLPDPRSTSARAAPPDKRGSRFSVEDFAGRWNGFWITLATLAPGPGSPDASSAPPINGIAAHAVEWGLKYDSGKNLVSGVWSVTSDGAPAISIAGAKTPAGRIDVASPAPDPKTAEITFQDFKSAGSGLTFTLIRKPLPTPGIPGEKRTSTSIELTGTASAIGPASRWVLRLENRALGIMVYLVRNPPN